MAVVKIAIAALALSLAAGTPVSAIAAPKADYDWSPFVAEAAARFGIPRDWIWRVMAIESRGRTTLGGRPIRSPKGAMGLMQLMPATWADMRAAYGLGADPDDPRDNILAGAAYLRLMYDRFGYPGLFAAYNAGPQRYAEFRRGRALPRETIDYLGATAGPRIAPPVAASVSPAGTGVLAIDRRGLSSNAPVGDPAVRPASSLFAIQPDR